MNFFVEKAQGLIEYALIVVLVVLVSILGLQAMGYNIHDIFCQAAQGLGNDQACSGHYLADDFDSLDNWQIVRGNWYIEDGKLCGGPGEGRIFAKIPDSGNYVINLNGANLTRGNGYGLYFRTSNVEHVNGYDFQFDPGYGSGAYLLRRWYQGYEYRPNAVAWAPNETWHNAPHDIKVVVNNDEITAFVDNRQVYQTHDSTWREGGVGLRTWDGTRVCFDSITVDPVP